jgi:hypothetical protein
MPAAVDEVRFDPFAPHSRRIYDRLVAERGFAGGQYSTVTRG